MTYTYKTGTVAVSAGSVTVTGSGTAWDLSNIAGGLLCAAGLSVPIADVVDDDTLTLDLPWPGSTASGLAYSVLLLTAEAADAVQANYWLADIANRLRSGSFLQPDATGTLAERAAFDGEIQGFVYVQTDVIPFLVYIKESSAPGDWSAGTALVGPPGTDGDDGAPGVGDAADLHFSAEGRLGSAEVFHCLFARSISFPADMAGSGARALAASTGTAILTLAKNGVPVGTITFTASATGVFDTSAVTFAAGDLLSIECPDPHNATLAGVMLVLAGSRVP